MNYPMAHPHSTLTSETIQDLDPRIHVPRYDRSRISTGIVHIGVGGFHRSHLASYMDEIASAGLASWAITGSGIMPSDKRMADVLHAQDGLYTLISRAIDSTDVRVIGSIVDYIHASEDITDLVKRAAHQDTKIVSLTVTEGGYPVDDDRRFDPSLAPAGSGSAFDVIVSALALRRDTGVGPVTVMSCDNVIANGEVTRAAVLGVAERRDPGLAGWIGNNVTFPNGMVDRITPATTDSDRAFLLDEYGLDDAWPVVAESLLKIITASFS
jgi:mannitol 2-dehydrogenase